MKQIILPSRRRHMILIQTRSYRTYEHLSIIYKLFQRQKAIVSSNSSTQTRISHFSRMCFISCLRQDMTMSMSVYVWLIINIIGKISFLGPAFLGSIRVKKHGHSDSTKVMTYGKNSSWCREISQSGWCQSSWYWINYLEQWDCRRAQGMSMFNDFLHMSFSLFHHRCFQKLDKYQ